MIQPVKTVPEILRSTQSAADPSRKPIRILVCSIPKGVESIVQWLHIQGFAQIGEWSGPLPSQVEGEVIRIVTRYYDG